MEGNYSSSKDRGIIPNSFRHIFEKIGVDGSEKKRYLVRASYLEIYNENIRDLLTHDVSNNLELKENADGVVYVKNLTIKVVNNEKDIIRLMNKGKKHRHTGATLMNQSSSRSHSIFTVVVETSELNESTGETKIRVGKLNLVDLAGSERQSKTGASGQRLKEATKINLSLSALGNVISSLIESKSKHIPYRDSKLTRLLQDSLGGNTKTVMIANCGPADYNFEETLSTLRYANRAKNIKNKPKINEDPKDAMLREYQNEIEALRQQLQQVESGAAPTRRQRPQGSEGPRFLDDDELDYLEKNFEKQAQREKLELDKKAKEKIKQLESEQKISEHERAELEIKLKKEGEIAMKTKQAKASLQNKLKFMEEKLLIGGLMMDKAAKQEQELRKAEGELEERKIQQRILARKVVEKEEEMILKDEKYFDLQDEVEAKTKKIKKLWNKYQTAKSEIKDLHDDFQREREDLSLSLREVTKEIKLYKILVDNFIPKDFLKRLLERVSYDNTSDEYVVENVHLSGNNMMPKRPLLYAPKRQQKVKNSKNSVMINEMIAITIELPEPTVKSHIDSSLDETVNVALLKAQMSKKEESSNVDPFIRLRSKSKSKKKKSKTSTFDDSSSHQQKRKNRKSKDVKTEVIYPVARGLVTKNGWD